MAATVELKYFNTFLLKKVIKNTNYFAWWPNVTPANKQSGFSAFPGDAGLTYSTDANFYVEEARITGGFNNTSVDFGVKAYITETDDEQDDFVSGLIHSGIYNSRTGINNTNQFSIGEAITRTLNPQHGSIQKLYAEDTNLITLQEDKSQRILIDKDTIYTTESGTQTQTAKQVLGQIVPYLGQYGISKNPESFAVYGGRKYYADKNRNAILRLSRDGITEVSQYGMFDFFRDDLAEISDEFQISKITCVSTPVTGITFIVSTNGDLIEPGMQIHVSGNDTGIIVDSIAYGVGTWTITASASLTVTASTDFVKYIKDKIVGGWDIHNKNYVVSTQDASKETFNTLSFEDGSNAWISFYSYKPNFASSLKNHYYTFKDGAIWRQYDNNTTSSRANFYGVQYRSNITFIFNPNPSVTKNFQTISYEGSNGWEVESFVSDFEGLDYLNNGYQEFQDTTNRIYSYIEGRYDSALPVANTGFNAVIQPIFQAGFDRKENKYVANLVSNSAARPGEIIFKESISGIKGYFATVKISSDEVTDVGGLKELYSAGSNYVISSY